MSNPVVSVLIITYNQEKTISQCIDSVLIQNEKYHFEIIIAEDCSSDSTKEICLEYQQKYPSKINLLLQSTNQGILKNYIDGLKLCKGKYIAQCAGDDYWIDNNKILKQVEFFENSPEYGVVCTNGYKLIVERNKLIAGIAPQNPSQDVKLFYKNWIGGVYAMPLSVMFKSELLKKMDLNEFIKREFFFEDAPMQAIMAQYAKFGYLKDFTCVYRVYNKSTSFINFHHPKYILYHKGIIAIKEYLHKLFPNDYEFDDKWARNYLSYRFFLKAVYSYNYNDAVKALDSIVSFGLKERKARIIVSNKLFFFLFCVFKKIRLEISLNG